MFLKLAENTNLQQIAEHRSNLHPIPKNCWGFLGDSVHLWLLRTACAAAITAAALALPDKALAEPAQPVFDGPMHVVDGDGLWFEGQELRLHGIDAFETSQPCHRPGLDAPYPCGIEAREKLARLLRRHGNAARCEQLTIGHYGRPIVSCTAGATELGEAMIASGWAMAYVKYLEGEKLHRYVAAEKRAKRAGAGAWAGTFTQPWDWRRRR
ncbi:thermonuclease family protein [Pyruvatibacter sp.]